MCLVGVVDLGGCLCSLVVVVCPVDIPSPICVTTVTGTACSGAERNR